MSAEVEREVERMYDVPLDAVVPDLAGLAEIERVEPPDEVEQVATYFDTDDARLLEAKVTLRRRVGGVDDGWHLKLPVTGDARHEVRLPLGEDDHRPPAELLDRVRVHVRDREVAARHGDDPPRHPAGSGRPTARCSPSSATTACARSWWRHPQTSRRGASGRWSSSTQPHPCSTTWG